MTSLANKIPFIGEIVQSLQDRYKDFDHHNKKDPLDELLYIICSTKTNSNQYINIFGKLKSKFPQNEQLLNASTDEIALILADGGLSNLKTKYIKSILGDIVKQFGSLTLTPLYNMSDKEVETFLTSLQGVGKKVARCVMLYSLNRKVFPVDSHCWRICQRLAWVTKETDRICRSTDMDYLQELIPPDYRFSLHVNMISLGREICKTRKMECSICPINEYCPKVGTSIVQL